MNMFKILSLSIITFSFSLSTAQANWTLQKDKDDIKVYTKTKEGQKLKASKAEMLVNASVERILEVLSDIPNYVNWTPKTESAKMLKKIDNNNFYYYTTIKAPLVKNRDLVVKVNVKKNGNITTVAMVGVPNFIAENDKYVRMPSYSGVYSLTKISDKQTKIVLEYAADPGGGLPDWLVNTASVDVPYDIFSKLRTIF